MSIFSQVLHKIFGGGQAQAAAPAPAAAKPNVAAVAPTATPAVMPQAQAAPAQTVDVEKVLDDLAAKNPQKLDWRHSIVDMLKLLDIDSSLQARKELAAELHYTGSTDDSAAMNLWLHKAVMDQLAKNGGKVPASLMD
jgi:hypothetical protein